MKKALKIILIIILAIIIIPLIVAFFVKKEYAVEREISINAPKEIVFSYLLRLKNQDNFSVWAQADPNMKKTYTGNDGNIGFISAWESDNKDVGKGEQEIMKIENGHRIDYEIRFFEPFKTTDNAYIITDGEKNSTIVKWGFSGKMNYPMNLMLLFMDMEEMLGNDLQTGLINLKEILDKK